MPDNLQNEEFDYDTVTLYDEENNATEFSVIDGVEYKGKVYLALVETAHIHDEECEFTILRSDKDGQEDVLVTIEDENEFNAVMELFDEKLDEYDVLEGESDSEAEE